MLKFLLAYIILIISSSFALSDETADIEEFNAFFSEYSELVQNKEDIDATILVAEKIYRLAPRLFGRLSDEAAVTTYNLASLYDEKGREEENSDEKQASSLYKSFFRIQNIRNAPKDIDYINKYIPYIIAYYNSHPDNSSNSVSDKLLEIAYGSNLTNIDLANVEFVVASLRSKFNRLRYAKDLFQKANQRYVAEFGQNHFKVAETAYMTAKIDLAEGFNDAAEKNLLKSHKILKSLKEQHRNFENSTFHLLAIIYIQDNEFELAEKYYKQIKADTDNSLFLIPINKPASHFFTSYADRITYSGKVKYDVGKDGVPFNITSLASYLGPLQKAAIKAAATIRYYPPYNNGKPTVIKIVEDYIFLRPRSQK